MPGFLDTNILLYSISTHPAEREKRNSAIELLGRSDCVLSVQVLQEFYVQSTRATRSDALAHETAAGLIATWLRFEIVENTMLLLSDALAIHKETGFSFWDSAIVAAARIGNCDVLYTEDLTHGRRIGNLRIVNPFL